MNSKIKSLIVRSGISDYPGSVKEYTCTIQELNEFAKNGSL